MTVTRRISKIIKDWIEYNIVWWWSEAVDTQLDPNSENPVQNKVIKAAIDAKLDAPAEEWEVWQFVRKGADGNEWVSWDLASIGIEPDDYSAVRWPCSDGFHIANGSRDGKKIRDILTVLLWKIPVWTDLNTYLLLPNAWYLSYITWELLDVWVGCCFWTRNWFDLSSSIPYINWTSIWSYWPSQIMGYGNYNRRWTGYPIRPIKDTEVVPDNSWTTLLDWSSIATWAWVFHNLALWLISLSSDWEDWITIADKNLGATSSDISSTNSYWYYYQWWNNYWFTAWSIITSSTRVDASSYWPWNYYNSSTFIKTSNNEDWSTVQNNNLRWWDIWVIKWWWLWLTVWDNRIVKATETSDWFMSASDKKKLNNLDHLEENALVWELYTLSDTLFRQLTPTLANSTIEQNVWNIAANTQIHIQRLGSWTASNQLKLKLKKVWTPWDLSVQVMKWVKITVTANVEAYWYWDSNNILASWTVSASSITTSWQEITVTLDNKVWWTEWELLDIVLSIPSVNASNYVVIACDSTQWSEWFSFVAVNGSTRTRSKLMPYCISDWFAQSLLCKCDDAGITIQNLVWSSNTVIEYSGTVWVEASSPYKDISINATNLYYEIGTYKRYWATWVSLNNKTKNTKITDIGAWSNTQTRNVTGSLTKDTNDILTFKFDGSSWQDWPQKINYARFYAEQYIYKSYNIKWLPRELKNIGNKSSTTIFGIHIDRTRVTQDA